MPKRVLKKTVPDTPEAKAARIEKELVYMRRKIKEADGDTHVEGLIQREALEYLLDAHDAFPKVLEGLSEDFDKVVVALREAATLIRGKRS